MSKVNPKIDIVFKKLFGSDGNKKLLKSLVNSILPENEQITELELKNPYNPADYVSGKLSYLDIKATDNSGRWYDVEIQIAPQDFFGMRVMYYWAKLFSAQLQSDQTYIELRKTIVISILNFVYFEDEKDNKRYHRNLGICDLLNKENYPQFDGLSLHFIELKKFDKDLQNITTTLDRWITFLNKAHEYSNDTLPKELAQDDDIKTAIKEVETMYFNEKEREYYESQEKLLRDHLGYQKTIERKREKEIAKQMLEDYEPLDKIIKYTGLPKEDIEKLK
ncbi:MAG: Rpn family recombination-promoting nuclease/putative transposase [Bacteroidia bacterium]|nr:Rpn family recombination-promoting nuclease/putative transposase [Bacteroidia bacterium]